MKRKAGAVALLLTLAMAVAVVADDEVRLGGPTPTKPPPRSEVGDLGEGERAAARELLKAMPEPAREDFLRRLRAAQPQARAELLRGLLRARDGDALPSPVAGH
jgi:predicted NBD/HSP70 family sugar kinase